MWSRKSHASWNLLLKVYIVCVYFNHVRIWMKRIFHKMLHLHINYAQHSLLQTLKSVRFPGWKAKYMLYILSTTKIIYLALFTIYYLLVCRIYNSDLIIQVTWRWSERPVSNGNKQHKGFTPNNIPSASEVHYLGHELTGDDVISSALHILDGCIWDLASWRLKTEKSLRFSFYFFLALSVF